MGGSSFLHLWLLIGMPLQNIESVQAGNIVTLKPRPAESAWQQHGSPAADSASNEDDDLAVAIAASLGESAGIKL